ncbi:hypothetical protein ACHWQZ_G000553 [Mnemiopsis leidyi]
MKLIHRDVSDYTVGAVCGGAVLLGILLSFLLWWCCKYKSKENLKLKRRPAIIKKSRIKPVVTIDRALVEKSNNCFEGGDALPHPDLSPVPPPLSPARMKMRKVKASSTSVVQVQPSTRPSATSSLSDVVETDNKTSKLERRYEEGKIASMKINVYHESGDNELVISVIEVRSIHSSINYQTASVELRRENGRSAGKLTPVKLVQKSGKLKGTGSKYKFPTSLEDLNKYKFNFYLWSTDKYSRTYQAGNCLFKFKASDFLGDEGITIYGDFEKSQKEDTSDCVEIGITLRYINRNSKLVVGIQSISNVQKSGWRRFAPALSDSALLQPRPIVKITLSGEDGKILDTQRTDPIRGYSTTFSNEKRFMFDVPLQELKSQVKLTLELSHSNMRVAHSKIGQLEFSWESTGSEGEHWREMIQMISSDQEVPKSHFIRHRNRK